MPQEEGSILRILSPESDGSRKIKIDNIKITSSSVNPDIQQVSEASEVSHFENFETASKQHQTPPTLIFIIMMQTRQRKHKDIVNLLYNQNTN